MNKHYTSIEQSKHLLKLGLNPETADMHYGNFCPKGLGYADAFGAGLSPYTEAVKTYETIKKQYHIDDYKGIVAWEVLPCWSLGALIDLMPKCIETKKPKNLYFLDIYPASNGIAYATNGDDGFVFLQRFVGSQYTTTLIEHAVSMVCWLLKKGYIKKGETK